MAKQIVSPKVSTLQILTRAERREIKRNFSRPKRDLVICTKLIDLGYLDGWVTVGSDHQPIKIADLKITEMGQEFLEQHRQVPLPSRRVLNRKTRVLLKGLVWYFLLLGFFILLRASGGIASSPTKAFAPNGETERNSHIIASRWPIGGCGIPPMQ